MFEEAGEELPAGKAVATRGVGEGVEGGSEGAMGLSVLLLFATPPTNVDVSVSPDWMDWIWLLLSFIVVWAVVRGVGAGVRTLRALERQADAMTRQVEAISRQAEAVSRQAGDMKEVARLSGESARAAATNAQALINSERAWMVV